MQANLQLYQPHLAYLRRAATSFHNILNALKLSGAAHGQTRAGAKGARDITSSSRTALTREALQDQDIILAPEQRR
jgi:hypothetical protein